MLKKFLFVVVLSSMGYTQSISTFPLWGSTWVVAQGDNKNAYASVLPLAPEKLAIVDFSDTGKVTVYWANLTLRGYKSTADFVDDITKQIGKNSRTIAKDSIGQGNLIDIAYNPYNDTVWSGDAEAIGKIGKYQKVGRKTGTTDSVFGTGDINRLTSTPGYFKEKPLFYGIRTATTTEKATYSLESTDDDGKTIYLENKQYIQPAQSAQAGSANVMADIGNVNLNALSETSPYQSYRIGNTLYEYIPVKYVYKTASVGIWQVHIHPEMWYYPRDPFDGTPLIKDGLKMDFATAKVQKKKSIDNPGSVDLKYYRNPYFSDSASVVISFAFKGQVGGDMKKLNSVSLADTTVDINHYPNKMYRVLEGTTAITNCMAAIFQLYSRSPEEEAENKTLNQRCSQWAFIDKMNGEIIFPSSMQKTGSPLIRDTRIDNGVFLYNGCPCSQISSLNNLTPVQLQRLLYLNSPLCDRPSMEKACTIYTMLSRYLKAPKDVEMIQKRMKVLYAIITDRDAKAKAAGVDWSQPNGDCPSTWVNDFRVGP